MRTFEKDYKYLLINLIPHNRLSAGRRRRIEDALLGDNADEIRRQAVLALEELCDGAHFSRSDVVGENGHVVLTYVRNRGAYQLRLVVPAAEWQFLGSGPVARASETLNEPSRVRPVETTIEILPQIIRSLAIGGRSESTIERLESVLETLPLWFDVESCRLLVVAERFSDPDRGGRRVAAISERALLRPAIYAGCRQSGKIEIVGVEAARSLGIAGPLIRSLGEREVDYHIAVVPIFAVDEFCGILEAWVPGPVESSALRSRVRAAGNMVGQIIENAVKLENLTSIDKLTDVYNRHFYDAQVRIEIERATRSESKLTLLVLDIDDFKKINDTMGHRKGDEALAMIADLIKKNLRKIDLAFRYGGEEFVILLPRTPQVEAVHTAERLRTVIGECNRFLDAQGTPRPVQVSIGGAVFPDNARTEEELFSRADAALYKAKNTGKNRVEFYRE